MFVDFILVLGFICFFAWLIWHVYQQYFCCYVNVVSSNKKLKTCKTTPKKYCFDDDDPCYTTDDNDECCSSDDENDVFNNNPSLPLTTECTVQGNISINGTNLTGIRSLTVILNNTVIVNLTTIPTPSVLPSSLTSYSQYSSLSSVV